MAANNIPPEPIPISQSPVPLSQIDRAPAPVPTDTTAPPTIPLAWILQAPEPVVDIANIAEPAIPGPSATYAIAVYANGVLLTSQVHSIDFVGNAVITTVDRNNVTVTINSTGGGNGVPGGNNQQVQFNNNGEFGGVAGFTFNSAGNVLTVLGNVSAGNYFIGDGSQLTNLPLATNSTVGVVALGNGFTLNGSNQVTTSSLYNTNLTQPTQHYALSVDTNGVVILPDQSIINGSTLRAVAGSYAGLTTNDGENSWMWVDSSGAYIATQYNQSGNSHQWTFDNTGNLILPDNNSSINYANGDPYGGGGSSNYGDSNVATFLGAFGSNTINTTGTVTAGNVTQSGVGNVNGYNAYFANNITAQGTLQATGLIIPAGSGTFYGNVDTGVNALFAGVPGYTELGTNVVAQFAANVNSYAQLNFQNLNSGDLASADYILTADNGNNSAYYLDLGLASSTHVDPYFFGDVGFANDGYLTVVGPTYDGPSTSSGPGNLVLGSSNGLIKMFVGNASQANVIATVSSTGLDVVGNITTGGVSGNITGANVINANTFAITGGTELGQIEGANTVGFYNPSANTQFLIELGGSNAWSFNGNTGGTGFPILSVQRGDNPSGTISGQTLLFDNAGQEAIISTPDGVPGNEYSQRLVINPGAGNNYGEGGDIYLWAGRGGDGSGSGGDIKIRGGQGGANTVGGVGGDGGYIRIEAGDAASTGGAAGYIEITGGVAGYGTPGVAGGRIAVTGGYGQNGNGGDGNITGGFGGIGYKGGNVNITGGGANDGLASYGNVNINAGASAWKFDNTGVLSAAGNIIASNFIGNVHNLTTVPVTYSQLYTLATGGDLVPLTYYTITDYQTIYDQPDFYANGLPVTNPVTLTGSVEPLIVFATGVDTLDPQAYSTANGDDTIIYNIGITTTEINGEPTKGAITSRESSEGNLIGYDFRAVVLKRYESVEGSGIYNSYKDTGFAYSDTIPTFGPNCENIRLSVQDWGEGGFDDSPFRISNNVFGQYSESIVALGDFYNNTFGEVCYGMTFGHFCRNNTLGDGFANNEIGNEFANNIIGANSIGNHIGNGFANNTIPGALTGNEISDGFANNGFVGVCANNVIGDGFAGNEIEEGFTNNYLGSNFAGTSTGINFTFNHIGDNFATKTVGANATGWNIQNNFVNSSISDDNAAYTVIESLSTTSNQILKATQGFLQATSTLSEAEYGANVDLVVTTGNTNVWTFDHTGNLTAPGNISLNGGYISGGVATVLSNDGIYSIALGTTTVMDVYAFPFTTTTRGQLTISGITTTTQANGTWYYQSINTNTFALYTDSTYTTPVNSTTWTPYPTGTGDGVVAITLQSPAANIVIDANGFLSTFNNIGGLDLPGSLTAVGDIGTDGNIIAVGNVTGGNIVTSGAGGDITMTGGNITGANVVTANTFIGNGSQLTGVTASIPSQTILPTIQTITATPMLTGYLSGGEGGVTVTVANIIPVTEYGVIVTAGTVSQKYATGALGSIPGTGNITFTTGTSSAPFTVYAYVTSNAGTYYSNAVTGTSGLCLLVGTQIALSDGTRKAIEDITYTDKMLSWDFDLGCYAETTALWIKRGETGSQYNLLTFSDGTTLRTFDQHRIFNKQAGAFTYPMTDATPIGTITVNEHGQEITLVNKQIIVDTIEYYNVITDRHMNLFSDTVLTSCRFNNIYPITNMKFVKDDRIMRTRAEFENIPDRFFYGLRLAEQTTDVETVEWYVNRLLATEVSAEVELAV